MLPPSIFLHSLIFISAEINGKDVAAYPTTPKLIIKINKKTKVK